WILVESVTVRRGWVSIRTKLIVFIAIPIVAIVTTFAWFSTYRQLAERVMWEDEEANTYGDQFALELRSAIAFGDRATASEVLGPVTSDPDVASTTLYDGNGEILYRSGEASPWIDNAKYGVIEKRLVHTDARCIVVVPVLSLEGPRGTLVIEISTIHQKIAERRLVRSMALFGGFALLFGVVAAVLIARSLASRLRKIGDVATAATHDASVTVTNAGADEIGVLADAFNEMLQQLRSKEASLEFRVAERTKQLETEMDRRSEMEPELRQAQKLESVGRLAAGIAHEINSPVQFVAHSCTFIDESMQMLIESMRAAHAQLDRAEKGEISVPELVAQLKVLKEDADIDGLIEAIPDSSKLALQGLERVTTIVRAMKEFAYADQRAQTPSDLNRAIQNTLLVTCNEYKYVADTKVVLGSLPPVVCHVGEFNQAILNIVVNAAHAIEDANRGTSKRGCITVKTWTEADDAVIAISDDGCGIPDTVIEKIFDPFFTTKEIGRGSGQGLAIARSVIVDKHAGRLDVQTRVGQGTTFTIRLPIAGMAQPIAA
ncbi:MAG TPA: ATP-binding protein, partial [Kofleriaceae bacterium]